MTLRPCTVCGEPSPRSRCDNHRPKDTKTSAASRGYNNRWTRLSKRARRLAPFCEDCGSVTDLQTDHSERAWERHAAGLPIRLKDVTVVCGPCNRARGAARGSRTRGEAPSAPLQDPHGKAKFGSEIA